MFIHQVIKIKFLTYIILDFVAQMLSEGKDPKPKMIEICKPKCVYWKEKLSRCEKKLE
jgi:hypothetical protein